MSEETSDPGFSDQEERALTAALDEIIPPSDDGRLPGAGELGLARFVDEALQRTPALRPVISQGLAGLDDLARGRSAQGFAALPGPDRSQVLNELASAQPGFLPGLMFLTYAGYYQDPRVVEALGLEPRPPFPKGYDMEPNELSLLDEVRQRPTLFRTV
jgi:hypothetical protein